MKLIWKSVKTSQNPLTPWNYLENSWRPTEKHEIPWNYLENQLKTMTKSKTQERVYFSWLTHKKRSSFVTYERGQFLINVIFLCASAWNKDHQSPSPSPWWQPGVELWWQRGGCRGCRGRQDSSQEEHTKPPRHWIINCKCVCIHVFVIYWCIKSLLAPILHYCQSSEV